VILAEASNVRIAVYDILGKRVKTLYNGFLAAGHHQLQWDGRDDSGTPAPTGIYVYRLNDKEGNQLLGKMYLLR
jgi:flagellar hook assembly protein FlgD